MPEHSFRRESDKLTFSRFVDWGFLAMLSAITLYGSSSISSLNTELKMLQEKVSAVLAQATAVQALTQQQNSRIDRLEDRFNEMERITHK